MNFSFTHNYFTELIKQFPSASLVLSDGSILHSQSEKQEDNYSLVQTFKTAKQFISLKKGDVVLVNDPYSGGSHLRRYTFITPFIIDDPILPEIYLCVRKNTEEHEPLNLYSKSIEDEGIRIPPTPIYNNFAPNLPILEAISSHPKSHPDLKNWVNETVKDIFLVTKKEPPLFIKEHFSLQNLKKYLVRSKELAINAISESAHGDSQSEMLLLTGETLKLKLTIENEKVIFDFSGSSGGQKVFLTEAMTLGACWFSLLERYNLLHLFNSGTLELIQVIKPTTSFLNAKYPNPTLIGAIEGIHAIRTISEWGFLKIASKNNKAPQNLNPLFCQIQFQNKKVITFNLPNGTGTTEDNPGESCISDFHNLENLSVQELENNFPIQIIQIGERITQQKKAKTNGGAGLHIKIKLLSPAKLVWTSGIKKNELKLKGKKYHAYAEPEIQLINNDKKETLPFCGEKIIEQGQIISLLSGTGVSLIQ